jgi:hypothetical protein
MPTQKLKLTNTEDQEYRTRLSRLEKMDIQIGHAGDPSHEPDGITLEQIEHEFARIYELPSGAVAVVVPAKMIVLKPGILITDVAMMTPWDDFPLDLSDPEGSLFYKDLIGGLYHFPPRLLNPWLKREVPLRPRQVEGVIVAHGWSSFPSKYHDESLVTVELLLRDERRNELCFDFGVRVDRSVKRKYERRQRERREFARSTKGGGLYERKGGQPGDQKSVSPEEAIKQPHASGEHDATCDARTPETKLGDQTPMRLA